MLRRGRTVGLVVLGLSLLALSPPAAGAQAADSASLAARAFHDAIGGRRWDAAAGLIHSDRLGIVRRNVESMVNGPSGDLVLTELLGMSSRPDFDAATNPEIFARLLRTLERRIEPLARVMSTNEVEIVGAVPDGNDAHVVIRVTPYADGPRPSWIRVLSARRETNGAWRITDAEEITAVSTAVLGLPLR